MKRRWTLVATIIGSSLTFTDGTAVVVALLPLELIQVRRCSRSRY